MIDSHCHLNHTRNGLDVQTLVTNAQAAGVEKLLTICTQDSEFGDIYSIVEVHENVYGTYGIHPHHAGEEGITADHIRKALAHPKIIGIGETGLDYYYDNAPREAQQESFRLHLEVAQELGVPVVIHNRDSDEDCMKILDEAFKRGPLQAILHCFSSGKALAEYGVEKGLYLSASGIITFKKSVDLRDIFSDVPPENLLIETDAPFLAPTPYRGKENQPAYVVHARCCIGNSVDR